MKMTPQHFTELQELLSEVIPKLASAEEYAKNGLTPMRRRWDALWLLPLSVRLPLFRKYYKYLNDDHIDTALRHIFNHKKGA